MSLAMVGDGELPAIADDLGADVSIIMATTAPATTRTTVAITIRRVPIMLVTVTSFRWSFCGATYGCRPTSSQSALRPAIPPVVR